MAIPQLTYPDDLTPALEGQIVDVGTDTNIRTYTDPANATFFGRAAVQGSADDTFIHPVAGAGVFIGVTTRTHYRDPSLLPAGTLEGTPATKPSNIMTKGRVRVIVENQVSALTDPVFYRHQSAGASPEGVGRFRSDNDGASGDVTELTAGARWLSTNGGAGEFAELEITLP